MSVQLRGVAGASGVAGAVITIVFGVLHPKGASDVGTVSEWMRRVGASDIWTVVHFMLLLASLLLLLAAAGIARSYPEETASAWAEVAFVAMIVSTGIAVVTFLIDGPVVKRVAELWETAPRDPASIGAARFATAAGFILVAGLQLCSGIVALLFGRAGLATRAHPRPLAWLALGAGITGTVPGAVHYIAGAATWSVSMVYVSSALFAIWILLMSLRIWRTAHSGTDRPS